MIEQPRDLAGEIACDFAYRRRAYHSSCASFDNTAHLVTCGLTQLSADFPCRWISASGGEQWVYVDLGSVYTLHSAAVSWGKNYALDYSVQVSIDASDWSDAARASGAADRTVATALSGQRARYLRILCHASSGDNYIMYKLAVFGESAPPMDAACQCGWDWRIERASEVGASGAELSSAGFDASGWLPARVPGTALVSYLDAGAIPDPNYDDHQLQISDAFFNADFWYTARFELPQERRGQRVLLNFDAVNWKADVYINGEYLPNPITSRERSIEGAFIRGRFDITPCAVLGGYNYLAVRVYKNDTPGEVSIQGLAEGPMPNGGALGADNPTLHAAVGWDWLPTIRGRGAGLYGDVYITYAGAVQICDAWVETRLNITEKPPELTAVDLLAGKLCAEWVGDTDGSELVIDIGEQALAGSATIIWGSEAGGAAADLESRHAERFALEVSTDGIDWRNFDAHPGGEVDAMWFGMLSAEPHDGSAIFEGHAISDSVQGATAFPVVDMTAWGRGVAPFPVFDPALIRYLRLRVIKRRVVGGRAVPVRVRELRLYAESPAQVEASLVREYALDEGQAEAVFRATLVNRSDTPARAVIEGVIMPGDIRFTQTVPLAARESRETGIGGVFISSPRLWWPNTYGEQFLYTADVTVTIDGEVSSHEQLKFGVRRFDYPTDGGVLTLYCNGVRIVLKGGNWGMDDGLKLDTPERYDAKVRLHAEANMTMIRNWVGMTNHRAFYEACDRYGILVWDDFWLANPVDGPDPNDVPMFLENAADKIMRVRQYASLALYCGRNEGSPPEALDSGLRSLCASIDGTRLYIPNSAGTPVGSGGGYSLARPGGEHGIKQYFSDVSSTVIRSERGIPNIPCIESLRKFVSPENLWPISECWALHDFTFHMNGPANSYMAALKSYMDGAFDVPEDNVRGQRPDPDDPVFVAYKADILKMCADAGRAYTLEDFDRMAQMINYENHKGLFEALRVRRTGGLLMWMSQSSWPSFMWQTYDWYLDTNGGYYGVKSACAPVHAVWDPRDDSLVLSNSTPRELRDITTCLEVFDIGGRPVFTRDYQTGILAADSYGVVLGTADFAASGSDAVFIRLTVRDGGAVLDRNFYWHNRAAYQDYRALNALARVTLDVTAERIDGTRYMLRFENNSSAPAVQTRVRLRDGAGCDVLPVFFSDNYFALMPGEAKTVTAEAAEAVDSPCFELSGWNTADTVIAV